MQPNSDLALSLADSYPALADYCPILNEISLPQAVFLLNHDRESLYGGAVGGGKSAALLMAALMFVDVPGYAALILRRNFPQLTQPGMLIPLSKEWIGGRAHWSQQERQWTFPSGAVLRFGHVEDESAALNYQGGAYHFVGFDELTQFSENAYTYIAFSRQRRSRSMADLGVPIRVRATANPGGIGHMWVKNRFIEDKRADRLFVPARVADNPAWVPGDYEASLQHLPDTLRRQLLDGDWDVFEGAAYRVDDDVLVDRMVLPDSFDRFEFMDHGVSNPTAWYLAATDYDGNVIVADEYYRPGMPDEHVREILDRRNEWWSARDTDGRPVQHPCWGDPASLRETLPMRGRLGEPATLQSEYQHLGVVIAPGNNRRRAGFVRIAALLKPQPARTFPVWHPRAGESGAPRMFIVAARCPHLVEQLRNAPLASEETDPERGEAVDRRWEGPYGHAHAALRYGVMSLPDASVEPVQELEDPRARLLARVEKRFADSEFVY